MAELTLQLPSEVSAEEAQLMLMMKLFETGRLSLGQAARLAGYSKSTFIELLGKMGGTVFDYPAENLQLDISDLTINETILKRQSFNKEKAGMALEALYGCAKGEKLRRDC